MSKEHIVSPQLIGQENVSWKWTQLYSMLTKTFLVMFVLFRKIYWERWWMYNESGCWSMFASVCYRQYQLLPFRKTEHIIERHISWWKYSVQNLYSNMKCDKRTLFWYCRKYILSRLVRWLNKYKIKSHSVY